MKELCTAWTALEGMVVLCSYSTSHSSSHHDVFGDCYLHSYAPIYATILVVPLAYYKAEPISPREWICGEGCLHIMGRVLPEGAELAER